MSFNNKLLLSAGECIQRVVNNINYITLYSGSCNGKPNCRILASRLVLNECGLRNSSYLHVKYVCAQSIQFLFYIVNLFV